ncbi:Chloride channel protein [Salix suchowensis]|nr:Chloride channel protein [Salix suchowensis]
MAITEEEVEFLETRKLLKEQIRKRNCSHHLSELSNSHHHHKTKTYGSFFGPSQPCIAPRVIQESKRRLLSLQTQIPQQRAVRADILFSAMDNRTKVQRLRQTRDYSFLFSDDDILTLPVSSATPAQPPLACSPMEPLTNKRPIVKAVHSAKQLAGSNDSKGSRRPNISSPVSNSLDQYRPKKRRLTDDEDDCEGEKALLIIRKMFNTKRFSGRDDGDRKMEASFGDIMKEEKRSERLGRKEDQEQLRLLEENAARRQRMRTSAKKHNQGTRFVI